MHEIIAGLVATGFVVLWIYCICDVITTDDAIIRHLPKLVWLLIVLLLADIGSILWLGLGRPRLWATRAADPERSRRPPAAAAPGAPTLDDPALERMSPLARSREEQARLRVWEAQLKRREDELRRRQLDEGPGPD